MCGIIWGRSRKGVPVAKKIRKLYHKQRSRGMQGFGFAEIGRDAVGPLFRAREEHEIMRMMAPSTAREMLFHHRWPTSTPNTPEGAHPIPVSHKSLKFDYLGVHNGVIRNTEELHKKYDRAGFNFTTTVETVFRCGRNIYESNYANKYNDSEYLMMDLAQCIENESKKTESDGSIAFILIQFVKGTRKPIKMFYGRNTNPLMLDSNADYMTISSEGSGKAVEPHKLHCLDYETGEITVLRDFEIGTDWEKRYPEYGKKKVVASTARTNDVVPKPAHVHYKGHGRQWDATRGWYDYDDERYDDEIEQRLAGFSTVTHNATATQDTLQLPGEVEGEINMDDEDYGFTGDTATIVETDDGETLKLRLSAGETKEYYFLQELEFDWLNLVEEIEYWRDRRKANGKNAGIAAECNTMLAILEADDKIYRNELKKYPEVFEGYKEKQEAAREPVAATDGEPLI